VQQHRSKVDKTPESWKVTDHWAKFRVTVHYLGPFLPKREHAYSLNTWTSSSFANQRWCRVYVETRSKRLQASWRCKAEEKNRSGCSHQIPARHHLIALQFLRKLASHQALGAAVVPTHGVGQPKPSHTRTSMRILTALAISSIVGNWDKARRLVA
jgi:hypothetical protein